MYNWAYVHIVSPVRQSLIVYNIRKGWQNLKKKKEVRHIMGGGSTFFQIPSDVTNI